MGENIVAKKILAALFVLLLAHVWVCSSPYAAMGTMDGFLKQGLGFPLRALGGGAENALPTMEMAEASYADSLWRRDAFLNLNGFMAKALHMRGYYSDIGIYIAGRNYIVSPSPWTSTDYEYDETLSLHGYLAGKGIQLIYVNEPTKYLDDGLFMEEFGLESYSNRNADVFLRRIKEAGVPVVDLREELVRDGMDIYGMFYRTDHHWTTRSGLWAAGKIAESLNKYSGYAIDASVYDESNFSFREWGRCWLGEQGRKVAASYVGLDDYTEIKPKFPTDFSFKEGGALRQGTFDDFVDEDVYNTEADVYQAPSWHYSYLRPNVRNNGVGHGKVLVLGDSFEHVVVPFLSLGVSEVDSLVLRDYAGSLREYIDAGDYDTVLVCYAQFMIGAHDNPQSANYGMFSFE